MKDLDGLVKLIKLAQGQRTQNEYALHCGISSAAITRICLGQYDPKPPQLKKLALRAYNGVTYEQLMTAAGYLDGNEGCAVAEKGIVNVLTEEELLWLEFYRRTPPKTLKLICDILSPIVPSQAEQLSKIKNAH